MPHTCKNTVKIGIHCTSSRFANSSCYSAFLFHFYFYTGKVGFDCMSYTKSYTNKFSFLKFLRLVLVPKDERNKLFVFYKIQLKRSKNLSLTWIIFELDLSITSVFWVSTNILSSRQFEFHFVHPSFCPYFCLSLPLSVHPSVTSLLLF